MSSSDDSKVLGVVLLIRHGDRQGFYQSDTTYTATATNLTALGNQQEFQLGQYLRSLYINASSPSNIADMNETLYDVTQTTIEADAGGEGDVIMASAISLVQGLWPATTTYNTTLANGSTIVGPLGGYQYVPVHTVEVNEDVSLEGFTDCNTFNDATLAFYNSTAFQQVANQSASFLDQLPPYLDGRPVTLENMWNIFDYINVNSIHNAAFAKALPPTFLAQAQALANYHEYGVFSSPQVDGPGNIAGRTMVPLILNGINDIANASNPIKLVYAAIAYKPFLSIFNMTQVAAQNPQLAGVVNYAAAVAIEVREPSGGGSPVLRFNFKNGTQEPTFTTYNWLGGSGDMPVSALIDQIASAGVNTTAQWCTACNNNVDRGCGALALASASARAAAADKISPIGAGFLGAGLTLFVVTCSLGVLAFLGVLTLGSRRRSRKEIKA